MKKMSTSNYLLSLVVSIIVIQTFVVVSSIMSRLISRTITVYYPLESILSKCPVIQFVPARSDTTQRGLIAVIVNRSSSL